MLKVVYPAIKAADPQAQVLVGGLLLDCDPVNPPPGKDCAPSRYMEGILRGGGADYFDGISYHAYDFYMGGIGGYGNANWHSSSTSTGPVLIAKTRYLQGLLAAYGVTGKYLMNTEAAILCDGCVNHANFDLTKAYYVPEAYAAALAYGLRANLWYEFTGWRNSNLVDQNLNPLPAYTSYDFLSTELGDADYLREIHDYANIMGYEFKHNNRNIWLLWSLDGNDQLVNLPELPLAIFDALGNSIPNANSILVNAKPVYIEFTP
jgi:hypothetical protein